MSTPGLTPAVPLKLQFPQSLAVYDDYAKAQRSVDFLADADFPVDQLMIVGTELKRTALMGATFGLVWALLGYAFTRGQRDFSSVTQVVATKYEVLVENKHAARARELLAGLPGALPDPFA